jgi:dUTPase
MNWSRPVEEGDRIAQLVIEKIETPSIVEVDVCVV